MKITKRQLKKIIQEELRQLVWEQSDQAPPNVVQMDPMHIRGERPNVMQMDPEHIRGERPSVVQMDPMHIRGERPGRSLVGQAQDYLTDPAVLQQISDVAASELTGYPETPDLGYSPDVTEYDILQHGRGKPPVAPSRIPASAVSVQESLINDITEAVLKNFVK